MQQLNFNNLDPVWSCLRFLKLRDWWVLVVGWAFLVSQLLSVLYLRFWILGSDFKGFEGCCFGVSFFVVCLY